MSGDCRCCRVGQIQIQIQIQIQRYWRYIYRYRSSMSMSFVGPARHMQKLNVNQPTQAGETNLILAVRSGEQGDPECLRCEMMWKEPSKAAWRQAYASSRRLIEAKKKRWDFFFSEREVVRQNTTREN